MEPYPKELPTHIDSRGALTVCQSQDDVPFDIKRVFWITHVKHDQIRGGHAHKTCHQFILALSGSVRLRANGHTFILDSPNYGVHIPPGNYLELDHFTHGTVVLALCSHPYDPKDYDYD